MEAEEDQTHALTKIEREINNNNKMVWIFGSESYSLSGSELELILMAPRIKEWDSRHYRVIKGEGFKEWWNA